MLKNNQKYPKVPKSTQSIQKYAKVPNSIQKNPKVPKVPNSTKSIAKVSQNIKKIKVRKKSQHKNLKLDKTQKLKMLQYKKKSTCCKSPNLKMWQNLKIQKSYCDKTKKLNCEIFKKNQIVKKGQQHKLWQNFQKLQQKSKT